MGAARSWWSVVAGLALAVVGLVPAGGPAVAAAAPVPVVAPSAPVVSEFSDVPGSHPFYSEISWLAGQGITTGYADGTFHPTEAVSRQAMAAFLYRYAGRPVYTAPVTARFTDVPTSHPFYTEISWLAEQGITTGYADGSFHPTEAVSRQAMAAFLYRYAHRPTFTAPVNPSFGDVPAGAGFFTEIEWLASTRITTGYADHTFHPVEDVSRQAMAAFLYRYADRVDDHTGPGAVGFVGVSGVTQTSVTLSWTVPTDADVAAVVVRRAEGPTPPVSASDGVLVADLGPAATGVTDSGLVSGTVYSYAVFARDEVPNFSAAATTNAATTPVLVDEVSYTLAAGVQEAASGDVTDVSSTAGEVPVDGSGVPTGDSAPWQATVVLAAGVQVPGVGEDFVIAPGDAAYPEGVAGVVTAAVANGDGTTTLTLGPVALDEVFADLHVTYSGPVGDGTWDPGAEPAVQGAAAADLVPGAASLSAATIAASTGAQAPSAQALAAAASGAVLDCKDEQGRTVADTVTLATDVRFENLSWHFEADLGSLWADPFVAMWVSAEPVVSVSGAASMAMTCDIAPAWTTAHTKVIPVPAFPGTTLSLGPYLEFEVNAAASVELSQRMYWMGGFITNPDGILRELRGSSADPLDLNVSGQLEVAVRSGLIVQLGYLDRAGIYGKAGFELAGSVSASAGTDNELCATAHLDAVASMGVFLDVWVARWEYQALTLSARLWGAEACFAPLPPGGGTGDPVITSTTLISRATDGTPANNYSYEPSVSADGRWITYESYASNLVPGDTNGATDVFVTDRTTGVTTLVSTAADGTAGNGLSNSPAISADGQWITYSSWASDLVPGDTNGATDVFVTDRTTGVTTLVSTATDSTQGNSWSGYPAISTDGRWITYWSYASNLVPGDTNGREDVFLTDRTTGVTTLVSRAADGTPGYSFAGSSPSISADGRWITYQSYASNLVPGDTNGVWHVFVTDRTTGVTSLVSAATDGTPANGDSAYPSISADGRWITYWSYASNLVPGDTNGREDVFLTDRTTGVTTLVSAAADGTPGNNSSSSPAISADGRWITYNSSASNLVPGDTNWTVDVFVTDRTTGLTSLVSAAPDGTPANDRSGNPSVSADGRWITYQSDASNLVPGDTNQVADVFVSSNPGMP